MQFNLREKKSDVDSVDHLVNDDDCSKKKETLNNKNNKISIGRIRTACVLAWNGSPALIDSNRRGSIDLYSFCKSCTLWEIPRLQKNGR